MADGTGLCRPREETRYQIKKGERRTMDFDLTDEHKMLKDMAYKFAVNEIAPISLECDKEERYTPEIRKKAAEQGLVAAWIPEQYGGAGVGFLGNVIITEELSRVDMGIGLNVVAASFGCEAVFYFGTEEQKQKWLVPMAQGKEDRGLRSYRTRRRL